MTNICYFMCNRHFFVWFAFRSRKIQVMAFVSFTQSLGTVKYSQLFLVRIKKRDMFMCSALVLASGIKNDVFSCVARLFRLME